MRYYIYLDRIFLRVLFSALEETDFNIEVVEYSIRESNGTKNEIAISPFFEKGNDCDCTARDFDDEKKDESTSHNGCFHNEKIGVSYEHEDKNYYETERRYINIQDITEMKNNNFYHKLTEKIRSNSRGDDARITEEVGFIQILKREDTENSNSKYGFFYVNNTCIWYEKEKLDGDVELLSQMSCKVKVIGYIMNCLEKKDQKVIKAIAIFIE